MFLSPLISSLDQHCKILGADVPSDEFASLADSITDAGDESESILVLLAASVRLLNNDVSWSRFAPGDFYTFQNLARRLAGRANGMTVYFTLADTSRDPFPLTPAPSGVNTPAPGSPILTRPPSPARAEGRSGSHIQIESRASEEIVNENGVNVNEPGESPISGGTKTPYSHRSRRLFKSRSSSRKASLEWPQSQVGASFPSSQVVTPHHHGPHLHLHLGGHSPHSLLHLSFGRRKEEHVVGVFESQRYMNLEATRLHDPYHDFHTQNAAKLLRDW